MVVLGVDWGDRRIGLSVSDPDGRVAVGVGTIHATSRREAIAALLEAARERDVEAIVIGLPITLRGTRGPRAEKTERVIDEIRSRTRVPVWVCDERFTTAAARRRLRETGAPARSGPSTDEVAATLLLQNWLDARRAASSPE
jgi:putative Holliday junction resolvase